MNKLINHIKIIEEALEEIVGLDTDYSNSANPFSKSYQKTLKSVKRWRETQENLYKEAK